jgi:hypothetical protein
MIDHMISVFAEVRIDLGVSFVRFNTCFSVKDFLSDEMCYKDYSL